MRPSSDQPGPNSNGDLGSELIDSLSAPPGDSVQCVRRHLEISVGHRSSRMIGTHEILMKHHSDASIEPLRSAAWGGLPGPLPVDYVVVPQRLPCSCAFAVTAVNRLEQDQ